MKKNIFWILILVSVILVSCATDNIDTKYTKSGEFQTLNNNVTIETLIENDFTSFGLFYVEDWNNGHACYIYENVQAGSIFCFELGK